MIGIFFRHIVHDGPLVLVLEKANVDHIVFVYCMSSVGRADRVYKSISTPDAPPGSVDQPPNNSISILILHLISRRKH